MFENPGDSHATTLAGVYRALFAERRLLAQSSVRYFTGMTQFFDTLKAHCRDCNALFDDLRRLPIWQPPQRICQQFIIFSEIR